jgi:hypothetical protein
MEYQMTIKKRFFGLIAVFAAVATAAFAQVDMAKVQAMRASMHQMHAGKVTTEDANSGGVTLPQVSGGKILVFTDKKYYLPGEEIKIRALGLAADANQLQVVINERLTDPMGNGVSLPQYLCECGDSNGGYVPSLTGFNFITLVSKKVPQLFGSRYDFNIIINRFSGNGQQEGLYQQTFLTVLIGVSNQQENNPIRIDTMMQVAGANPLLFLTGTFPVNIPLYQFTGAAPYDGSFSARPEAVSTDGSTLVLPGLYNGTGLEGRVVLMLPDGSFSTTSPQTFVLLPQPATRTTSQPIG